MLNINVCTIVQHCTIYAGRINQNNSILQVKESNYDYNLYNY